MSNSTTNTEEYRKLLAQLDTSLKTDPATKYMYQNFQRGLPLGNVVYRQNQRDIAREQEFWRTEIQRLDKLAREAPTEVENPQVGDFKRGANGFLYRWTDKSFYNGRTGRMSGPHWAKALRKFNYEPNLTTATNRHRRIGFQHQLPEPYPPINNLGIGRTRPAPRPQTRKNRRSNRKTRKN